MATHAFDYHMYRKGDDTLSLRVSYRILQSYTQVRNKNKVYDSFVSHKIDFGSQRGEMTQYISRTRKW